MPFLELAVVHRGVVERGEGRVFALRHGDRHCGVAILFRHPGAKRRAVRLGQGGGEQFEVVFGMGALGGDALFGRLLLLALLGLQRGLVLGLVEFRIADALRLFVLALGE